MHIFQKVLLHTDTILFETIQNPPQQWGMLDSMLIKADHIVHFTNNAWYNTYTVKVND